MSKKDIHVKLDPALAAAIREYAGMNAVSFTAALSSLAARGLRDEGITITEGDDQQ